MSSIYEHIEIDEIEELEKKSYIKKIEVSEKQDAMGVYLKDYVLKKPFSDSIDDIIELFNEAKTPSYVEYNKELNMIVFEYY